MKIYHLQFKVNYNHPLLNSCGTHDWCPYSKYDKARKALDAIRDLRKIGGTWRIKIIKP